jgi:hypothetical protein
VVIFPALADDALSVCCSSNFKRAKIDFEGTKESLRNGKN